MHNNAHGRQQIYLLLKLFQKIQNVDTLSGHPNYYHLLIRQVQPSLTPTYFKLLFFLFCLYIFIIIISFTSLDFNLFVELENSVTFYIMTLYYFLLPLLVVSSSSSLSSSSRSRTRLLLNKGLSLFLSVSLNAAVYGTFRQIARCSLCNVISRYFCFSGFPCHESSGQSVVSQFGLYDLSASIWLVL